MSETIADPTGVGKLAAALARAQAKYKLVQKGESATITTKDGRSYSYRYASLEAILAGITPALTSEELALTQSLEWQEHPWLITRLLHSGGGMLESRYPIALYDRPQEMGSAITYGRRYSIACLAMVAPEEDDDAQAAQQAPERTTAKTSAGPKLTCPRCAKADSTALSKFGQGWYCFRCKKGFGGQVVQEPGAEEGAEAWGNKAQVPNPGTLGRSDIRALEAECRRIAGDDQAARDLLTELLGLSKGSIPTPAAIESAWTRLASHPVFGNS